MTLSEQQLRNLMEGLWFKSLSEDLRTELLAISKVAAYAAKEPLFLRGDSFDGVYAVLAGSVRVSGIDSLGKEAVLTYVEPPSWFGELALFDGSVRTHDAHAEDESVILKIPRESLNALLNKKPECWKDFGVLLSQKLRLSFGLLEDLALLPASQRLAKRLVMMAERYGEADASDGVSIGVQQEALGRLLNLSRQSTNQILKEFEGRGIISVHYGRIVIDDIALLKEASMKNR
jgi:CRP-like cAMP-binding protein